MLSLSNVCHSIFEALLYQISLFALNVILSVHNYSKGNSLFLIIFFLESEKTSAFTPSTSSVIFLVDLTYYQMKFEKL